MMIQFMLYLGYLVILGVDILRVVKCARRLHLDKKDLTWLTMCFSIALVAVLLIVGVLFHYKVNDNASYIIIAAMILVWVSFTTTVINLLQMMRSEKEQTLKA